MTLEAGSYIWATRGKLWGFRFLRDGGYSDPLPVYEAAFAGVADQRKVSKRVGDKLVLRFPDPKGRQDHARRVISHDFVIRASSGDLPAVSEAARMAWDTVAAEYEELWDAEPQE
ncbi:MAG: hypothetical protein WAS54_08520 [Scrofimicrobium sp.]